MKAFLILINLLFYNESTIVNDYNIKVTAKSRVNYILEGVDLNGEVYGDDPVVTILEGDTIKFNIDAPWAPIFYKNNTWHGEKKIKLRELKIMEQPWDKFHGLR